MATAQRESTEQQAVASNFTTALGAQAVYCLHINAKAGSQRLNTDTLTAGLAGRYLSLCPMISNQGVYWPSLFCNLKALLVGKVLTAMFVPVLPKKLLLGNDCDSSTQRPML